MLAPDSGISAAKVVKFTLYTLLMIGLQAHLIQRMPYEAMRIDLLLPVMFAISVEWSPLCGVLWAGLLGFIMDNFSGEFWGLHVGSFTLTVCLVNMASEKFDWFNPAYQVGVVGLCALAQSLALGMFLCFAPMETPELTNIWLGLGFRILLSALVAPLLIYPILKPRSVV
jgi:rod shape-determining protein MreD